MSLPYTLVPYAYLSFLLGNVGKRIVKVLKMQVKTVLTNVHIFQTLKLKISQKKYYYQAKNSIKMDFNFFESCQKI